MLGHHRESTPVAIDLKLALRLANIALAVVQDDSVLAELWHQLQVGMGEGGDAGRPAPPPNEFGTPSPVVVPVPRPA